MAHGLDDHIFKLKAYERTRRLRFYHKKRADDNGHELEKEKKFAFHVASE